MGSKEIVKYEGVRLQELVSTCSGMQPDYLMLIAAGFTKDRAVDVLGLSQKTPAIWRNIDKHFKEVEGYIKSHRLDFAKEAKEYIDLISSDVLAYLVVKGKSWEGLDDKEKSHVKWAIGEWRKTRSGNSVEDDFDELVLKKHRKVK